MMFWSKIEYGSNRSIAGKARASCKVASAWWEHQSDWVPVAGFAQAERWAWAWEGTSHDSRDADQGFLPAIWLWFICSTLCFQPVQYFWVFACKCLMHLAMQSLGPRLKPSFGSLAFQMKTARVIQQALAGGALWEENSPIVSRWVWRWKQQRVWLPTRRPWAASWVTIVVVDCKRWRMGPVDQVVQGPLWSSWWVWWTTRFQPKPRLRPRPRAKLRPRRTRLCKQQKHRLKFAKLIVIWPMLWYCYFWVSAAFNDIDPLLGRTVSLWTWNDLSGSIVHVVSSFCLYLR